MTRLSLFFNFDVTSDAEVAQAYRDAEAQVVLADRLGYDGVWVAEHHFASFGRSPAPLQLLARLSALAPHLTLGTAIAEAPHYHPLRLAEEAAFLDHVSGGRLQLGLGTGGESKRIEYEHLGVDFDQRNVLTRDAARTVVSAFDDDTIEVSGEALRVSGARIQPRAVSSGRDTVWLAASDETAGFAGTEGLGLLFGRAVTRARRAELLRQYREALGGRRGRRAALVYVFPDETDERARERSLPVVEHYAERQAARVNDGRPFDWDGTPGTAEYFDILDRLTFVVGSSEHVTRELQAFAEENEADELLLQFYAGGSDHASAVDAMTRFSREVAPALRGGAGPAPRRQATTLAGARA